MHALPSLHPNHSPTPALPTAPTCPSSDSQSKHSTALQHQVRDAVASTLLPLNLVLKVLALCLLSHRRRVVGVDALLSLLLGWRIVSVDALEMLVSECFLRETVVD
jgi:hypothetical protein